MASYTNNDDKVNLITKTGTEVIADGYTIDISSILDSSSDLASTLNNEDEIIVVRKFDTSSISPAITADEAWAAYTLPNSSTSGSTMYTLSGGTITFSQTDSDYSWTTTMSGRAAAVALPALSSSDTIYVLKKVHNVGGLVTWSSGSKISSKNLNVGSQQLLTICQELMTYFKNFHTLNPSVGRPNGILVLNSSGTIDPAFIDGTTLGIISANGVSGSGTASSPLTINLDGDSLGQGTSGLKVNTQDNVTSTSTTQPLSANQGKLLNDAVTSLGTGIVYKGAFNVIDTTVSAASIGTLSAGVTVGHNGGSGTADSSWGVGSVANGNLIRYNGSAWQIVNASTAVLGDGSVDLADGQKIAATPTANVGNNSDGTEREAATCEYVEDAIVNTTFDELSGVYVDDTSPTGNDMVYYDGNSWEPIQLENSFGSGEKVLTTGSSIKALSDVYDSMSPSDGQSLTWDHGNSRWAASTVSSVAYDSVVGGTADGATHDYTAVNSALTSGTLGQTTASSSSTTSILNFRGRNHAILSTDGTPEELVMPCKRHLTLKDGGIFISYNACMDKQVLKPGTTTQLQTTTAAELYPGDTVMKVADVANFAIGDLIRIIGDALINVKTKEDADTVTEHAQYHLAKVIGINDSTDGDSLIIDEAPACKIKSGSLVERSGEGTNGANQIENVTFLNMRFKDLLGKTVYLNDFDQSTTPFTTTANTTLAFQVPTGHGMNQSGGGAILVQDADLGGDGVTHKVAKSGDINRWMTLTGATDADTFVSTMASAAADSANYGGDKAYVTQSRHSGVHIKNGSDIIFRDCVFENFNGEYAVLIENCKDVTFENCKFKNCRGSSYMNVSHLSSCIRLKASSNIKIKDCTFESCTVAVFVDVGSATAHSETQYLGCSNIDITNCNINSVCAFKCGGAFIYGSLKITDCDITPFVPNPNRPAPRYFDDPYGNQDYKDGSYNSSAIEIYKYNSRVCGVEHFELKRCNINKLVRVGGFVSGDNVFSASAFWGNGDGMQLGGQVLTDGYVPVWYDTVKVLTCTYENGSELYMGTTEQQFTISLNSGIEVSECNIAGISSAIRGYWTRSTIATEIMPVANRIKIKDCTLYGLQALYLSNALKNLGNENVNGLEITNNHIHAAAAFRRVAGLFNGATRQGGTEVSSEKDWYESNFRGIWVKAQCETNQVQSFVEHMNVVGNIVKGDGPYPSGTNMSTSSHGMIFGNSSDPLDNKTFNRCDITGNCIRDFRYPIYTYISESNSGRSIFERTHLHDNSTDVWPWYTQGSNDADYFTNGAHNKWYNNYYGG